MCYLAREIKLNAQLSPFSAGAKRYFIYAGLTPNLLFGAIKVISNCAQSTSWGLHLHEHIFFLNMWYFSHRFCLCHFCIILNIEEEWAVCVGVCVRALPLFFHMLIIYIDVFILSFCSSPFELLRLHITRPNLHVQTSALNPLSGVYTYVQWCG